MSPGCCGLPSASMASCALQKSSRRCPSTSTAWSNPRLMDHEVGLMAVRVVMFGSNESNRGRLGSIECYSRQMATKVNPRPYDTTNRQRQAAETQRRIFEAALELFNRDGYVATTIAAIAEHAGVAVQTVYASTKSK